MLLCLNVPLLSVVRYKLKSDCDNWGIASNTDERQDQGQHYNRTPHNEGGKWAEWHSRHSNKDMIFSWYEKHNIHDFFKGVMCKDGSWTLNLICQQTNGYWCYRSIQFEPKFVGLQLCVWSPCIVTNAFSMQRLLFVSPCWMISAVRLRLLDSSVWPSPSVLLPGFL